MSFSTLISYTSTLALSETRISCLRVLSVVTAAKTFSVKSHSEAPRGHEGFSPYDYFIIVYMWMFCLHICLCTMYVLGTGRSQKEVPKPFELELESVVSCHVGAGN